MDLTLSKSAQKVQKLLNEYNLSLTVIELTNSTRTAKDAAEAIGCEVGQIAKTLIFKGADTKKPICVIASGSNRVNEKKIQEYVGENIEKADAEYVVEHIGFVIGGVPPIGHKTDTRPLIDIDLTKHTEIWAAAGTPHAVFKLTVEDLLNITKGPVVTIK